MRRPQSRPYVSHGRSLRPRFAPPIAPRRRSVTVSRAPVVVKLGSSLVTDGRGRVRRGVLAARAREVAAPVRGGDPVCVVSSGAIALGLPRLGLERRPKALPRLQAASAL